jgi:Tfp pilus assembly protein PilN
MRAVNLIPAEQRGGAPVGVGRSQGAAYALLTLLAGLAVMAVLYGLAHRQVTSKTAEAASISAQAAQAHAAVSSLAPYSTFVTAQQQRTAQVAQIVDSRFDWAHVFHEFGRVIPATTSVTSLNGSIVPASTSGSSSSSAAGGSSSSASTGTSATPPGSIPTFTIAGCTTSQAAVADLLTRLHLIDGVSEVTLQSSTKAVGSSAASGSCPPGGPSFSAQVTFDPIPAAPTSTSGASTTVVVSTTSTGSAAPATNQKGVTVR